MNVKSNKHIVLFSCMVFIFIVVGFCGLFYSHTIKDGLSSARVNYSVLGEQEKSIPNEIKNVIYIVNGGKINDRIPTEIINFVAAKIVSENRSGGSEISWQINKLLLSIRLSKGLSEDEILSLYCHYLPYEHGIGLANSSKFYYSKGLKELVLDEMLSLLIVSSSPSYFSLFDHPERVEEKLSQLKRKYDFSKAYRKEG